MLKSMGAILGNLWHYLETAVEEVAAAGPDEK